MKRIIIEVKPTRIIGQAGEMRIHLDGINSAVDALLMLETAMLELTRPMAQREADVNAMKLVVASANGARQ